MIPLRLAARLALIGAIVAGCGGDGDAASVPAGPGGATADCAPPNRLVGDACREPGVQDDGCPAGTLGLGDGTCRPAGIPPEMCGEGFVHDGDVGCEPILPAEECPSGQMAVPGDTACRPVMPCAPGKWGDIAVDATTEHVDGSYAGGGSDGTAAKPWTTIGAAITAAAPGATVAVAAGSYVEDVDIVGTPVVLWGVCPDEVEIVGTGAALAALSIREQASGTVVRGLAITGAATTGILLSGSEGVLVHGVWVHDSAGRGINIENALGVTSGTVRGSLVEQNHGVGVFVAGAETIVEATVMRGTFPDALGIGHNIGIQFNPGTGAPSMATVRSSVVERNYDFGVFVAGSQVNVETTVVRSTLPAGQRVGGRGIGIGVQDERQSGTPSTATLVSSVVEQNREVGVFVTGSQVTIEATVVRGTQLDAQGRVGRGINISVSSETGAPSTGTVRSSVVEQNHEVGVFVGASEATIEATVVRGTLFDAQGLGGRGVSIHASSASGAPSTTATVRSSLVDQNHDVGVFVGAAQANVEGTVVRGTLPVESGLFGRGILIQDNPENGAPSTATVRSSVVEQNHEFGVLAAGPSDVGIEGCLVRATLPNVDARFGDGASAVSEGGAATLSVRATRIEDSVRAGVSSFGAFVSLGDTAVQCAAFDLEGEPFDGAPFTFEDRGGNICGCPSAEGECLLETVGIEPPTPVTPIE